jgi:hypothetical protein
LEERKLGLEEKKALNNLIAEANRTMMMDHSTMDEFTTEWCHMRRLEIISKRRQTRAASPATLTPGGGGGGGDSSLATTTAGVDGGATGDVGLA